MSHRLGPNFLNPAHHRVGVRDCRVGPLGQAPGAHCGALQVSAKWARFASPCTPALYSAPAIAVVRCRVGPLADGSSSPWDSRAGATERRRDPRGRGRPSSNPFQGLRGDKLVPPVPLSTSPSTSRLLSRLSRLRTVLVGGITGPPSSSSVPSTNWHPVRGRVGSL